MSKTLRFIVIGAFALLFLFVSWVVVLNIFCNDDLGDSKGDKALSELHTLGGAMRKLINEELTPAQLEKVNSMKDVAPLLSPMIEGNPNLLDPWGNQFILEKRVESGRSVITIRSSWQPPRRCFEWKKPVAGVEVIVSEETGKVTEVTSLWR